MEKLPTDYFAVVKWWTSLKIQDKLLAYLLAGIIALATTCFRLYSSKERLQATKDIVERENLNARIECEQRVGYFVTIERRRCDSVIEAHDTQCELEKQEFLKERTTYIKTRTQKIENALK